jgi:hypothetical protein
MNQPISAVECRSSAVATEGTPGTAGRRLPAPRQCVQCRSVYSLRHTTAARRSAAAESQPTHLPAHQLASAVTDVYGTGEAATREDA